MERSDARRKSSWAALVGVLVAIFALTLVAVSSKVLFAECLIYNPLGPRRGQIVIDGLVFNTLSFPCSLQRKLPGLSWPAKLLSINK